MSTRHMTLDEIVLCAILDALARNAGNVTQAAWELRVSRKTIYNRLQAEGLAHEIRRPESLAERRRQFHGVVPKGLTPKGQQREGGARVAAAAP